MGRLCMKILWFVSSYFPLYILLLVLNYAYIQEGLSEYNCSMSTCIFVFVMVLGLMLSAVFVFFFKNANTINYLSCECIEHPDDKVISYIFTYITPILSVNLQKMETIFANILLFLLVMFLYIRLDLFYINPLLIFLGYIPYKVNGKMVVSDIPFNKLRRREYELSGYYITNEIFVAKRKMNKWLNVPDTDT